MHQTIEATGRNGGLDLLRAIAISLVIFTHGADFLVPFGGTAFESLFASRWPGFLGVELFFCLSGFLIGTLLLGIERRGASNKEIGIFLLRRWMRTLPLYYLVLAALVLFPQLDRPAPPDIWRYALLVQNLFTPMPNWFGTSWSLTVEEWTYVVLPILAFYGLRGSRHRVFIAAALLCICAPVVRSIFFDASANWDRYVRKIAVMRLDAIAYGVLLACLYERGANLAERWSRILALPAIAILGGILFLIGDPVRMKELSLRIFMYPALAIAICALMPLIMTVQLKGVWQRTSAFLSKISYALYLVHFSMIPLMVGVPPAGRFPAYVAVSVAIATLLTFAIERPIMRRRPRQHPRDTSSAPAPAEIRLAA